MDGLVKCLLCQSPRTDVFRVVKKPARTYHRCCQCDLLFMDPSERLSAEEEKARYDFHENKDTPGYRTFLAPVLEEIARFRQKKGLCPSQVKILDFGCGPTAFLERLLREQAFEAASYDPFYFPDPSLLQQEYDVITSTEVWEHLHHPRTDLTLLTQILKPSGLLAVMTSSPPGKEAFPDWPYRRDLTHVTFYSEISMKWIAGHFGLELIRAQTPYWVFQKKV